MADGIELASAYVRLIPTTEGIGNKISETLEKETTKAGDESGKKSGQSFLSSFSNALKPVGDAMTKSLTVPIAGLATASLAAWKQVDDGMDTVILKTGATGGALKDLQDSVELIATSTEFSFKDVGTAVGEVNTRFGVTGGTLNNLSNRFLQFAKINGVDVNQSIDQVQKAISAFGLSADDTGAFLDTLNKVGQDTGVSMDLLETGLVTNATALQGMGLNAASAATLLGNLEKSGVDVSTAMVGLKKVQANAMAEGISMQEAFRNALSSSEGAISVFGAKAGPQLYAAFQNGTLSADMFVDSSVSLQDALGSVADTYTATLDPADNFKIALNNIQLLGYKIAEAVMPALNEVIATLIDTVVGLIDKWEGLDPGMQQFILASVGILAAAGPVISIISGITGSIGKLSEGLGFLMAHPIVAVIGAVIAALVMLYQNNEDFRNFVNEAWKNIQEVVGGVIDAIVSFWTNTLQPTLQSIGDFVQNTLWPILQTIFNAFGEVVSAVFSLISGYWNNILKPVLTAIGDAIKWLLDAVKGPLNAIKDTFSSVFNGIKSFVSPIVDWLKGIFNFNWSLPHISLPHFSLVGEFSLLPPKVPHLSVDWYDRATRNPRILDGATIFGARGNTLLGGGETAREIIMSENYLRGLISDKGDSKGSVHMGDVTININGYNGDAKRLAETVEEQLTNMQKRREMVFNG